MGYSFLGCLLLAGITHSALAQSGWTGDLPQVNLLFEDSGLLYVGSQRGFFGANGSGVYTSSDQGNTWVADSDGIGHPNVQSFAIVGGNIYAGADSSYDGSATGGVFRSTNKGASWVRVLPDNSVALASDGDTLFAGGNNYLYRTTDNGAGWDSLSNNIGEISDLFSFNTYLFAKTSVGAVYRSSDGGVNWASSGIVSALGSEQAFATIGNNIFALNTSGIWISSNSGSDWSSNKNMPLDTGEFISLIAAKGILFAARAGGGLAFSDDNGATWSDAAQVLSDGMGGYNIVIAIAFDGTSLILAVSDTDAVALLREPLSDLNVEANAEEISSFRVFPNPASSFLQIQGVSGTSNIELLDLLGRTVLAQNIDGNARVDVSQLQPGRYEAILHTANGVITSPVIIQHSAIN